MTAVGRPRGALAVGTAAKSLIGGRTGLGGVVAAAGPGSLLCNCGAGAGGVEAVVDVEPVGAGAAAWVVAGRLAQPLSTAAATSSEVSARCEQRVSMTPPFCVRWSVRFNESKGITAVEATTRDLSRRRGRG